VPRFAVIAALAIALSASSALAMYGVPVFDPLSVVQPPPTPPIPQPEPAPPASPKSRALPEEVEVAPVPAANVAPLPTPHAKPARAGRVEPGSSLGVESRLLSKALEQLRKHRDPKAALSTLDQYTARFPHGALAAEARAARVEALLAAGDKRAALALLDATATNAELVLRGELRLEASRVQDACDDFTAALTGTNDTLEARALYGRAACRIRLGDRDGGRRDLEEYVRRFPDGKSAGEARTALGRSR
jgi:hypothetical protein